MLNLVILVSKRLTREASMPKSNSGGTALATRGDIKGLLGDIDSAEMLAIMSLRPTIADIEQASVWLEGDPDVFGAGEAVQGVASEIIAILTENEEEEPPPAG
ncbi:hypothetical protein [Bradyrhizobium sp.]|uniref:hypothetical protein n=1 Tax=Bradyrhizobium sp. TaxID=376 RepID=UPI003C782793